MRTILFHLCTLLVQVGSACCGGVDADIRYMLVGGTTYRIDVIVYTCLTVPTDLPEINVRFDEGEFMTKPRTSITNYPASDLRVSEYSFVQDLIEPGWHSVDASLGGRGGGVVNIPMSIGQDVCIRAEILVDALIMSNTSIQFNTPPTELEQNWNTFVHDPAPSDADGDSLSFELIVPRGSSCADILGYQYPVAANFTWLDPESGTFLWDYPVSAGIFALAIRGSEYRNGQLIGRVTRDMALCIAPFVVEVEETHPAPLAIRPTLANEQLWIDAPGPCTAEIIDATGRTVLQQNGVGGDRPVALVALASGVYTVRAIDTRGKMRTARFVKTGEVTAY